MVSRACGLGPAAAQLSTAGAGARGECSPHDSQVAKTGGAGPPRACPSDLTPFHRPASSRFHHLLMAPSAEDPPSMAVGGQPTAKVQHPHSGPARPPDTPPLDTGCKQTRVQGPRGPWRKKGPVKNPGPRGSEESTLLGGTPWVGKQNV